MNNTLEQLQEIVLNTTDVNDIYVVQGEIAKRISALHKSIAIIEFRDDEAELKGELTQYYQLQETAKNRVFDLQNINTKPLSQFRDLCRICLPDEQYDELLAGSRLFGLDYKQFKKELSDKFHPKNITT